MFQVLLLLALLFSIGFTAFVFIAFRKEDEAVEVFEEVRNPVIMQVLVPRENDKTPLAAEQMFASMHGILRDAKKSLDLLSFEIVSSGEEGIRFYVIVPQHVVKFIEGQVYAQYPNADISVVADHTQKPVKQQLSTGEPYQAFVTAGEIELDKDFVFPVRTFRDFEVDPLAAVTGAMGDLKEGQEVWLQLLVRPVANYWQESSKEYISAIKDGRDPAGKSFFQRFMGDMSNAVSNINTSGGEAGGGGNVKEVVKLAPGQDEELRQIEEKMLKPGFEIGIRIIARAGDQFTSEQILRNVVASFKQFTTSHLNSFIQSIPEVSGEEIYHRYVQRYLEAEPMDIVNIEELASIFHLPNNSVETPNIHWSRARKAEPPLDIPLLGGNEQITAIGETDYRGERMVFGLKRPDRRRHMYVLGKTGVGKSSTFKNMIISDIMQGEGVCYVDPHGQDIDEILNFIPPQRINDVVYFNPADVQFPIGFNMLELNDLSQRDLVTDGVVSVFKKQFEDSWGPRLQYILQNTLATCIEAQGTSILAIQRMLIDKNYRKFILKHVNDPVLLKFWEDEFEQMSQNSRLITEAVAPIQNKVGRFISSAVIRNIVGQVKSTIDLREIMDNRKILLVNLAQGKIGEESASLLGGMIITRLQSAAMERVDIPEDQRADFYLYVDEFQNFATDSFAKILSEARKFRLNLTMTNQYIEQIPLTVRHAIFGNVGTLGSFVVSQSDASLLANEFTPVFDAEDLVSLESHSMYMKLCIDGMTSTPFSAKSLDYKKRLEIMGNKEQIVQSSRDMYGMPVAEIEDKIIRWSNQTYSEKGNRSVMKKDERLSSDRSRQSEERKQDYKREYENKPKQDDQKRRQDFKRPKQEEKKPQQQTERAPKPQQQGQEKQSRVKQTDEERRKQSQRDKERHQKEQQQKQQKGQGDKKPKSRSKKEKPREDKYEQSSEDRRTEERPPRDERREYTTPQYIEQKQYKEPPVKSEHPDQEVRPVPTNRGEDRGAPYVQPEQASQPIRYENDTTSSKIIVEQTESAQTSEPRDTDRGDDQPPSVKPPVVIGPSSLS